MFVSVAVGRQHLVLVLFRLVVGYILDLVLGSVIGSVAQPPHQWRLAHFVAYSGALHMEQRKKKL